MKVLGLDHYTDLSRNGSISPHLQGAQIFLWRGNLCASGSALGLLPCCPFVSTANAIPEGRWLLPAL